MASGYPAMVGIGMPWYDRDQFPRILAVMVDSDRLHRTFDEWEQAAEQGEASLKASGRIVVRAHLDPDEFVAWCAERDLDTNASARNQFAAEVAYRELAGKAG